MIKLEIHPDGGHFTIGGKCEKSENSLTIICELSGVSDVEKLRCIAQNINELADKLAGMIRRPIFSVGRDGYRETLNVFFDEETQTSFMVSLETDMLENRKVATLAALRTLTSVIEREMP